MRVDFAPFEWTSDRREVRQFSEDKSALGRGKEIILMTGQDILWTKPIDGRTKSFSAIGQSRAQDGKIYRRDLGRRRDLKCSSGIDLNTLTVCFDEKSHWFAKAPIGCLFRAHSRLSLRSGKRQPSKNAIVRCGKRPNSPWTNHANRTGLNNKTVRAGRPQEMVRFTAVPPETSRAFVRRMISGTSSK